LASAGSEGIAMASQEPARVGFVGLGNMGWPMARHLRQGGVDLMLFDARVERAARFAEQHGGRVAPDLAALARASEVVITMLPDGGVVREVALGAAPGLVEGWRGDGILVDMSSSDPGVYPEIEAALAARGGRLVDAPVSGAVTGAEAGTLTIMAGGEAGAIDRAAPLFGLMGQRLFRTGALGSGQAMKALNNLASAGAFLLTLEVLLIGQRSGLDPQLMTEILNVSTGRNNSTDKKIIPHVLSRRFDSGFALALMAKDLTTALALAERTGTPTMLGAPTLEAARAALAALGPGADHTALARWLEERVGEELRPAPRPRVPGAAGG
jgi:3-hydroxyisobutyrate dehydrogenase